MMRKEAKKRTLDELILQEVETELDKHYDASAYESINDTYGERSPTMTEIVFEKRPLGMSFSKNHNGCFIVQSVSGQSKDKHVKVGDIIVGICDKRVEPTWNRHEVAQVIREYSKDERDEPLAIIFDRQYRRNSVAAIKARMGQRQQADAAARREKQKASGGSGSSSGSSSGNSKRKKKKKVATKVSLRSTAQAFFYLCDILLPAGR